MGHGFRGLAVVGILNLFSPFAVLAADSDKDGIPDKVEEQLGTRPDEAEEFLCALKDGKEAEEERREAGYDSGLDIDAVWVAHAGGNRFVWRVDMVGPLDLSNTILHLYIDADRNRETGRKSSGNVEGVEYMVTSVNGSGRSTVFAPDGERLDPILITVEPVERSVFFSADLKIDQDAAGGNFELYVLCHSATTEDEPRPRMSDSSKRVAVEGVPSVDRPKVRRLVDLTSPENTNRTFGLDVIRATLRQDNVAEVRYDELRLDGFEVNAQTSRRFGHVVRKKLLGSVSCLAPAGSYHVGFLMYDNGNEDRIVFQIDGAVKGVAVANADNYRHWLYWLDEPIHFTGKEQLSLVATGPSGKHGICRVLFMPEPPRINPLPYTVDNLSTFTPVGEDGRVIVSWTTGMPSVTRFVYGRTSEYGNEVAAEDPTLAHRVELRKLDPHVTYCGRAIGVRPDGSRYKSDEVTFTAVGKPPPATREDVVSVPITVRNPHAVAAESWPVTHGVPFPRGELASADDVRLMRNGNEVPAQMAVTCRWLDGSVKWVLLTFMADVSAEGETAYSLEFGRGVKRHCTGEPIARREGRMVVLRPAETGFRIDAVGRIVLPNQKPCDTRVLSAAGAAYEWAGDALITIEENGPIRAVVKTVGRLEASNGNDALRIEKRVECFRGQPYIRIWHTLIVETEHEFSEFQSIGFDVPSGARGAWHIPREQEEPLELHNSGRIVQRFDREIAVGGKTLEARVTGTALGPDMAVAVRDFWQNYPKGFRIGESTVHVDLCPEFQAGHYDQFPFEDEGHQLYYYLLNGRYKLKRGMAKTHELFMSLDDECEDLATQSMFFHRPLLATPSPEWMCDSKAFYDVVARDETKFKAYENAIDANLKTYVKRRERQHDYGMMNYGDWYGERGSNWGNIEYDTQHAFLLEYVRSGNPEAFFLADQTERHNRDIDTIHWAPDDDMIGAVYVHQMCHVGGYYDKSVPDTLGFPRAGYSVSHAWAEGHFNHYFLTGDRRSYETGRAVVDYFARKMLQRPYDFTSCRVPGWHLIMNAIAYAATSDPYYLNVSRVIVDRVLETQNRDPRPLPDYQREPGRTHQVGGWSRMMVPGHCRCIPRHRGNAGFMVAVLLSGLKYFHDVTGDPAVKQSIIDGARYLVAECYSHDVHGFRYTSCPNTNYRAGCSPLMAEGIARAYRWTRDPVLEDVLTRALPIGAGGSGYGKSFSMYYRVAPRVLADLAASGLTLEKPGKD